MAKIERDNPIFSDLATLLSIKPKVQFSYNNSPILSEELQSGNAPSVFKTRGLDFQEVRPYQQGDDVRLIDWRITAKHNKPYTKLYMDEKERHVFVVCDLSQTMRFASQGVFKSVVSCECGALLGFLSELKKDKFSYAFLNHQMKPNLFKPDSIAQFLNALVEEQNKAVHQENQNHLLEILQQVSVEFKTGSAFYILSDFLSFDEKESLLIKKLALKGTCHLIHIYDKIEKQIPQGVFPISDGKDFSLLNTKSASFQKWYQDAFEKKQQFLKKLAQSDNIHYLELETDSDYIKILNHYLSMRGLR